MASVVFYMEDGTTLVHTLENDVTTIGRHPESNVVLTCPSSSGRHAIIKQTEDGVYVQDLGSSNGTRVNGAEIEEALLKDGDRVGFGDVQSVFYAGDAPAVLEEKPVPAPRLSAPLPPPDVSVGDAPPSGSRPAASARGLSPVRRAYGKSSASSYPDTTESGCMTSVIVTGLFVIAFVVGLAMRHSKEMNGNIVSDTMDKLFGSMPKIKIERKEE
ncbi:FHA domain-containing protein [Prosthecobacter sp.]|uniref:FHA domain-containing protein n=1 Tax=Prosthecobacter sp. TaxID=1965333 RepID=UPI001DEE75CA|nr:FHA domain-containing protein [Prosthecobacter sp.]MCB1278169.1 FHA domain-containing protein [Prosthecobacter sp.]